MPQGAAHTEGLGETGNGQKLSFHLGFISPEMLLEKCKALVAKVSLEDSQNAHQQVRLSWTLVKTPFLKSDVWSQQEDVSMCLCTGLVGTQGLPMMRQDITNTTSEMQDAAKSAAQIWDLVNETNGPRFLS